jgi:hypothetical protein
MGDPGDWGLLVDIIAGWASLALLLLAFVAGASGVRRRQGLHAARLLSRERQTPDREERWERPDLAGVRAPRS